MSRNANSLSLSASLKEGMSPLMILQKMHESSVAIVALGADVKRRRAIGRVGVLGAMSRITGVYAGLRRNENVVVVDMWENRDCEAREGFPMRLVNSQRRCRLRGACDSVRGPEAIQPEISPT